MSLPRLQACRGFKSHPRQLYIEALCTLLVTLSLKNKYGYHNKIIG